MQISSIGSSATDSISMVKMMAEMRKKMFAKLDTNNDGSLDKTELSKFSDMTGTKVEDLITKFDENKDGVLSKTETNTMFEAMKPSSPPPEQQASSIDETDSNNQLNTLLDELDKSSDESTTKNLFAQYLQTLVQKYGATSAASSTSQSLSVVA